MNKEQTFLLVVIFVAMLASLWVLAPFLEYVLGAVIFGYVLYPLHRRLEPHIGERPSAIALLIGSLVAVILPMVYIAIVLYEDVQAIAAGESGIATEEIESQLTPFLGDDVELGTLTQELGQELFDLLFGNVTQLLSFGARASLGLLLVIFLVYYVLKDGPQFARWAVNIAPMDDTVAYRLVHKVDRTTWGVVVGHILVAILQGVIGGVGLFLAGIPNVVFWTFLMIILALLPLIGAFMIWAPASAYLWVIGDIQSAVFLVLYGVLVVSLVDNYARPIVIDQSAHLNPGVILIGVFGGVYAIGFVGLFVGPIVFGILAATLTAFRRDFDALADHTPPPDPIERSGRYPWLGRNQESSEGASIDAPPEDSAEKQEGTQSSPPEDETVDPTD